MKTKTEERDERKTQRYTIVVLFSIVAVMAICLTGQAFATDTPVWTNFTAGSTQKTISKDTDSLYSPVATVTFSSPPLALAAPPFITDILVQSSTVYGSSNDASGSLYMVPITGGVLAPSGLTAPGFSVTGLWEQAATGNIMGAGTGGVWNYTTAALWSTTPAFDGGSALPGAHVSLGANTEIFTGLDGTIYVNDSATTTAFFTPPTGKKAHWIGVDKESGNFGYVESMIAPSITPDAPTSFHYFTLGVGPAIKYAVSFAGGMLGDVEWPHHAGISDEEFWVAVRELAIPGFGGNGFLTYDPDTTLFGFHTTFGSSGLDPSVGGSLASASPRSSGFAFQSFSSDAAVVPELPAAALPVIGMMMGSLVLWLRRKQTSK